MSVAIHTLHSPLLGKETNICTILPDEGAPTRLLYLLHGNGGDCRDWLDHSSIALHVAGRGLAVIMPEVENSYCTDMAQGLPFFSYLTQEVPAFARTLLGREFDPAHSYVAGLSMGGYGALKWALSHPHDFAAAATLSGSVDIAARIALLPRSRLDEFRIIFGDDLTVAPENDLLQLARTAADNRCTTRIFSAWGAQDSFAGFNRSFAALLESLPMDCLCQEAEGGHQWSFWDRWITPALDFMLD